MIHYRINGIGVKLIRKKITKDDPSKRSVYWQITFKRKSVLYFTGYSLTESEWEDLTKRKLRKHKEARDTFQAFFDKTLRPIIDELAVNNSFSFDTLDVHLNKPETINVNEAFQSRIESLEEEHKIGNASIYRNSINALIRFQHYKQLRRIRDKEDFILECIQKKNITVGKNVLKVDEKISFDEITPKYLNECERFWQRTEVAPATASIYMRTLRAVINNREGAEPYLKGSKYPFGVQRGKYVIPEGGRREIALPIEDIWKIENFETENEGLILARDIFTFMFYCNGINFGDLCRLRFANINAPSEEIIFQRKKTLKKGEKPTFIYVPILPPMVEIINRQGNKKQEGYIFPFLNGIEPKNKNEREIKTAIELSLVPINSSLKIIANKLNLDPELSTSYTRNSYITHLTSELLVNPIVVRKMVGHSTKRDVTAGYVNLTAKKRREINEKLLNPEKEYTINIMGKSEAG
jgi:integrase/recombinase XerD